MKKLFLKYSALYDKEIDGRGLAVFRISFAIILLAEVLQLYYFRHLVFDEIPYIVLGEIDLTPLLWFWIGTLLMLVIGLYTRFAAIFNYVFLTAIYGTITSYEYHMMYTYQIIGFLFIFLPVSKNISIDRLALTLK